MFHVKQCGWVVGKKGTIMNITNAQLKALLDAYNMIIQAQQNYIPINDISNQRTIKRFTKVLNDMVKDKIEENKLINEYYISIRKEL